MAPSRPCAVYVGTYDRLHCFRYDGSTGTLRHRGSYGELKDPSYLVASEDGRLLHAVSEADDRLDGTSGSVGSYAIDRRTGDLSFLGALPVEGSAPCHLCADETGRFLFTANYGSGSVSVVALDGEGRPGQVLQVLRHAGSGPDPMRQEGPHAHFVGLTPDGKHLCAVDLGLDRLFLHPLDPDAGIRASDADPCVPMTPGSGPRHLAFRPDGRYAYTVHELDSTVHAFACSTDGPVFREIQRLSTLPADAAGGNSCAALRVSADGRFLYASNRGHDSIAVFRIDADSGRLSFTAAVPTLGKHPRDFALDPEGRFLLVADQHSDRIAVFSVDAATGIPTPLEGAVDVASPTCILFVPLEADPPDRILPDAGRRAERNPRG